MSDARFNELLRGALHGPTALFTISRLALALRYVVDNTGDAGVDALEDWCAGRQAADDDADYSEEGY